jgi:hypothetical protein
MKTKTIKTKLSAFTLLAMLFIAFPAWTQVTIGSGISPTRAALLELKTRQESGTVTSVSDSKNVTSTDGGFLLPRVELVNINTLEPFIPADDTEFVSNTNSLKEKLAGLMVYNITDNGPGSSLYPAVYTWNGTYWVTSQINEAIAFITRQPEKFTFYESGIGSVEPLTINVDGVGTWTYQWYQVTGNNVHVRIGTPMGQSGTIYTSDATATAAGSKTASFAPQAVLKGTTRSAGNTGFYKFYCIATSSLGAMLTSDIAEVAVGCGAKNNEGEWISFMCFNLGAADNSTIASQKSYPIGTFTNNADGDPNRHAYITGEEKLWGGLFQWGRIADGHQERNPALNNKSYSGIDNGNQIGDGNRCSAVDISRPYQQVLKSSNWFGQFIYNTSSPSNWTPVDQNTANLLWRNGRFVQNDPCAHYKVSASTTPTYQEFWHNGTQDSSTGTEACTDSGTSWRIPSQDEWGAIYKGGAISGLYTSATANTWRWYNGTQTPDNYSRGYEIKPDGETTTLFLPASGYRSYGNGSLYTQGTDGFYWNNSVAGTNAYYFNFTSGSVFPANNGYRAYGFALRCIKNS